LLAGCGRHPTSGPEPALDLAQDDTTSQTVELPGWATTGDQETYGHETLYNLVDGQADAVFAYGFKEVAVQSYKNVDGAELRIRIWRLATPADAYGLYTSTASGEPAVVGNDGHVDGGRYLAFWQDQYYVEVFAIPELAEAEALRDLALLVSARLPSGGERPALLEHLPREGLDPARLVYFHEEISLQNDLWLGGENLLGLSPETEGVLARYHLDGIQTLLLLVRYPTGEAASAGLAALGNSGFGSLAASGVRDHLLGAVFGEVGAVAAESLLTAALGQP
jgi:hypothetical protein